MMRYLNFDPRATGPRTTEEQAERAQARHEMQDKLCDQIANGQDIDETETNNGDDA